MRPFSYTNRDGATYYLHVRRRAQQRPRYVMRKTALGAAAALPPGYEVRENVQGRVWVRRLGRRWFTDSEADLLAGQLERLRPVAYRLDITGRIATIYASSLDRKVFAESLDAEFAGGFAEAITKALAGKVSPELVALFKARQKDKHAQRPRFYPLLRLVLVDPEQRRFAVERVCFTGDHGWVRLEVLALTAAMFKYLPHLGKDSFFDLL